MGNGTVSLTFAANPGAARSGSLSIAGQNYVINQSAANCASPLPITPGQTANGSLQSGDCIYNDGSFYDAYTFNGTAGQEISIAMNSSQFNAYLLLFQGNYPGGALLFQDNDGGGGTNARIPATAGFFTLPATGTYTILANSATAGETGNYSLTFNVNAGCSYSLTPASPQSVGAATSNLSVAVTTASTCDWTATTTTPWITINSGTSGTGSGTVNITFAANTGAARSGSLTIAGQNYVINQSGSSACSYTLNPTNNNSVSATGATGSFNVTTTAGCSWTAVSSNAQWITITSGLTGSGNGTVSYCVSANGGQQRTGTVTIGDQTFTITQAALSSTATTKRLAADFDGDNKSDLSIFRPSVGQWWYRQSSNNQSRVFAFGSSNDKLVPADYDGDGKIDVATFTSATGLWSVLRSSNFTFFSAPFGADEDIPAPGDYDGDGKADFAVYRQSDTNWYINRTGSCGTMIVQFGQAQDIPAVGDYDGDGMTDVAVFRPLGGTGQSEWWIRRSTAGIFATPFGISTDKPVQGDYTGDGKTDVAFFRPSDRNWYILRSEDLSYYAAPFGLGTDVPVPGDYDGDGKYDLAVFRGSETNWYAFLSGGGVMALQFGSNGDRPVASAFIP
jgi:hypothetical protein